MGKVFITFFSAKVKGKIQEKITDLEKLKTEGNTAR